MPVRMIYLGCVLILALCLPALAQGASAIVLSPADSQLTSLGQTGLLGTIVAVQMYVIRFLYRRVETQDDRMLVVTEKLTVALTENTIVQKNQIMLFDRFVSNRKD